MCLLYRASMFRHGSKLQSGGRTMRTTVRACIKKAATVIRRGRYIGRLLAMAAIIVGVIAGPPMTKKSEQVALASFTLPPAPWGEFTPFYGVAPCIADFQDVGIFSPADAKADALVTSCSRSAYSARTTSPTSASSMRRTGIAEPREISRVTCPTASRPCTPTSRATPGRPVLIRPPRRRHPRPPFRAEPPLSVRRHPVAAHCMAAAGVRFTTSMSGA